ncbi:uncharacterized protein LOC141701249 [Apium graveolens]|uniref:uncharacterized protein LOC141701249 n=1 Tax=Apium graveolens TaxID=4045 RepID=UPI003D7B76F2
MEVLTAILSKKSQEPVFTFHSLAKSELMSHILFADDIFLFCKGIFSSINVLLDGVDEFSEASGLVVNLSKCNIFFSNVPLFTVSAALQRSGFIWGDLPIKFLGIPLVSKRLTAADCVPLINNLCAQILHWTSKFLSQAGRLQLIRLVLFAIQSFWASSSFSMWHDPWLGGRTLLDLFGFEIISLAESSNFALVRESLLNDSWNIAPSNHTLMMELRNLLNNTEISSSNRILWDDLSTIKTSDIWYSLRSRKPQVAWFHFVWHKVKVPKAAFLLWLAIRNRLLTRDRMIRFGISTPIHCPLCLTDLESRDHLFFSCFYSRIIISHCQVLVPSN